tara:strand:+ start:1737 stop:1997 length:261 start_codon:yes stop_codon:yes gene_type:complete
MAAFDLDKSISIEFHAEDIIERKMLGLWADPRFKTVNLGMKLVGESVKISMNGYYVIDISFLVFEQLSVKEIAEIIINKAKQKFNQ